MSYDEGWVSEWGTVARMATCAALVLAACGSTDTPTEMEEDPPVSSLSFMAGDWDVTSRYRLAGGGFDEAVSTAEVSASIGNRVLKEIWRGSRDSDLSEVHTMHARRQNGAWVVARADGGRGYFDVLEGSFADGTGTFTSRSGTRPDGGLERLTVTDITNDSFRWIAEESLDGGATWTEYWTREYTRRGAPIPAGEPIASACVTPEYHEFDFWIGDWDARPPGGVGGGRNVIHSHLDGCIVEENWSGGSTGTSFNMYDPRTDLWYQVWMDTSGVNLLVALGGIVDGQMILVGDNGSQDRRITWTANADGTVRQVGEFSNDNGANWNPNYDLIYTLRSSAH